MSETLDTTVTVTFEREKETKNTVRFAEVVDPANHPVVGTLYISKPALHALGSPERLTVTIAAD